MQIEKCLTADRNITSRGSIYKCNVVGDFSWFQGYEEIYCNNEKVYECYLRIRSVKPLFSIPMGSYKGIFVYKINKKGLTREDVCDNF